MTNSEVIEFTAAAIYSGVHVHNTHWCPSMEEYNEFDPLAKLCMHLEFTLDYLNVIAAAETYFPEQICNVDDERCVLVYNIAK